MIIVVQSGEDIYVLSRFFVLVQSADTIYGTISLYIRERHICTSNRKNLDHFNILHENQKQLLSYTRGTTNTLIDFKKSMKKPFNMV